MSFEDFKNYKENIFDFDKFDSETRQGFIERVGDPTELEAAIGLICISFNLLEEKVSVGIQTLLNIKGDIGNIVTSELSYKAKINLFSSLIQKLRQSKYFNRLEGDGFDKEYLEEFIKALTKCEELRNKVVHSVFISQNGKIIRKKITAKAKHGLVQTREDFEIYHLMNIYDYTVSMTMEIDDFFIEYNNRP